MLHIMSPEMCPDFHPDHHPDHVITKLSLTLVVITMSPVTPHCDLKAHLGQGNSREIDPSPHLPID